MKNKHMNGKKKKVDFCEVSYQSLNACSLQSCEMPVGVDDWKKKSKKQLICRPQGTNR